MTTHDFALTGPINLQARLGHGSLTVTARDDLTEAGVTLVPRSQDSDIVERIVVELSDRTLMVTAPRPGGVFDLPIFGLCRDRDAVDVSVTVPSGTPIKASSFTADVVVRGRCGSADIASGASDVTLDHVDGDLRLRYGAGNVSVQRVTGSVEARSGSGSARFGEIGGALRCGCGSGRVEVGTIHGLARFRAGSGDAHLAAVFGDVDVATGSGGLSVGLPEGRPARLDVTTGSGRVNSELPIVSVPTSKGRPIRVRARTGSGDIRLFRAGA